MRWLEVTVCADPEPAEAIAELFSRHGIGGAVIEQYPPDSRASSPCPNGESVLVKAYLDAADQSTRQKLEEALWHLSQLYPFSPPAFKVLEEEDWATAWRQDYQIQHIGEHIVIVPSWLEYVQGPDDIVLTIDPGMAFGTGLHPSTRLCLIGLEETALEAKSLLDVGTGSGILSIYAAQAGASPVVALEIDPIACQAAKENLRINGVEDRVDLALGSLGFGGYELSSDHAAPLFPGPFDVIAINILAEVIAEMSPALVARLAQGGRVIAAGIIRERETLVTQAWMEAGLRVVGRKQDGDWVSLVGTRAESD